MLLHLVRHAHALDEAENPARPLSPRGLAQTRHLAAFLRGNPAFRPAQLWHSPLHRSAQTAAHLLEGLGLDDTILVETPGLLPEDDPEPLARRLEAHSPDIPLALVGHEPHLGALATLLIRGKPHRSSFHLKKSAVLTLETSGETHKKTGRPRWKVRWQLSPELLPLV
ncbi:MAG: histidine phosphatase family protein [Verrucomicrobiota bacterium]